MDREALLLELRDIITGYLKTKNFDLVDIIYRSEGRDLALRILTDRPEGGITVDECVQLNRDISILLEEKGLLLETRYILEVSSPGIDRPLKTKSDFTRSLNKEVNIFLREPIGQKTQLKGVIAKVENESVFIDSQGEIIEIPIGKIVKAKQAIENF